MQRPMAARRINAREFSICLLTHERGHAYVVAPETFGRKVACCSGARAEATVRSLRCCKGSDWLNATRCFFKTSCNNRYLHLAHQAFIKDGAEDNVCILVGSIVDD